MDAADNFGRPHADGDALEARVDEVREAALLGKHARHDRHLCARVCVCC